MFLLVVVFKVQDNTKPTPSSLPMFKGSRNRFLVKVHLAEVDVRPDLGDTVLHLRDGVHQHVMAAPV